MRKVTDAGSQLKGGLLPGRRLTSIYFVLLFLASRALAQPLFLEQNWTPEMRKEYWFKDQGSRLMPLIWFQNLEVPDSRTVFKDQLERFGFVTDFLSVSFHRLPVGFSVGQHEDIGLGIKPDGDWVGITCAACHSSKIRYHEVSFFVDGAPSMIDFNGFLSQLVDSMVATRNDDAKWQRFGSNVGSTQGYDELKDRLKRLRNINTPDVQAGFGRLDAYGGLFNQIANLLNPATDDWEHPDAAVSYPCLWDTAQHPRVQWNGVAVNLGVGRDADGAAMRNVAEAIGAFGEIKVTEKERKYPSSVDLNALRDLEDLIAALRSPAWPSGTFGAIDEPAAREGEKLYRQEGCVDCHNVINRAKPPKRIPIVMTPVEKVQTDPLVTENYRRRKADSGGLSGKSLRSTTGGILPASVKKLEFLKDLTGQVQLGAFLDLYGSTFDFWAKNGVALTFGVLTTSLESYKARPLNGVWATAPYLHNGSVPNLWELLKEPDKRTPQFCVGNVEYDPVNVGYAAPSQGTVTCPEGTSLLDTRMRGNSNQGHPFGTRLKDREKRDLIEFLKKL
jgi:cytochrome c peroxidase